MINKVTIYGERCSGTNFSIKSGISIYKSYNK